MKRNNLISVLYYNLIVNVKVKYIFPWKRRYISYIEITYKQFWQVWKDYRPYVIKCCIIFLFLSKWGIMPDEICGWKVIHCWQTEQFWEYVGYPIVMRQSWHQRYHSYVYADMTFLHICILIIWEIKLQHSKL